jgi:tetratricopeptide (TPR) repeat protein
MQNEEVAALNRLESISADAPDELKFASFYNIGVLSYSLGNYEKSIQSFKDALLINPKSIHAKINLELALRQGSKSVQSSNSQIKTASESKENSVLTDAVFSIIRENEQKQWKNQEKQDDSHSSTDY